MFVEFLLSLFAFLHRTLSADTSGQTPHDICNFNSYALNYLRRSFRMTSLCLFGAVGRPHLYSSKGSFYFYIIGSSLLWNHSPSEWFSTYKKLLSPLTCRDRSQRCFCGATLLGMESHTHSMHTIICKKLITKISLRRAYSNFGLLSEALSPLVSTPQSHRLRLSAPEGPSGTYTSSSICS